MQERQRSKMQEYKMKEKTPEYFCTRSRNRVVMFSPIISYKSLAHISFLSAINPALSRERLGVLESSRHGRFIRTGLWQPA